jgi:hypothetical protein
MLGDSLVHGLTLYVLHKSLVWRARAAQVKGLVIALLFLRTALAVLRESSAGLVRAHAASPESAG